MLHGSGTHLTAEAKFEPTGHRCGRQPVQLGVSHCQHGAQHGGQMTDQTGMDMVDYHVVTVHGQGQY
jgi:hypothetical protein